MEENRPQPGNKLPFNFESALIIIFSTVFLFIALGQPWGNKIAHPFPTSYLASDAYFHQAMAEYAKEQGGVKWAAPWSIGGYEGVLDSHPPIVYHLAAALSTATGIEVYDSLMFLAVISYLLAILVASMIWRKANKKIAMLALPAGLLVLTAKLTPLIFWGYWLLLAGIMFMLAAFWGILHFESERSIIPLAFFFSALALSHQPEFTFAGLFFAALLAIKVWKERSISKDLILKTGKFAILTGVLVFYSLLVFSNTFLLAEGFRKTWDMQKAVGGYPPFDLVDLGIFGLVALGGIVLFFISRKDSMKVPAVSLYCFILGYFIWLGMGKRAYAHRLFWIIYLSFFFGLALYTLLKLIVKSASTPVYFGVSFLLIGIFAQSVFSNTNVGQGSMNQYDWDALKWISESLPKDAWVYYFYSDALASNAPLYNAQRVSFNIRLKPFIEAIQQGKIRRSYSFHLADGYPVYIHPNGLFSFCFYNAELKPRNDSFECLPEYQKYLPVPGEDEEKDVCGIEYAYFARAASTPALAQYGMAISELLLKNDWIKEIYSNPLVSIVHNEKPGVDCFGNFTAED
ncbi:hypothetical protein HYU13_04365 [Candidatus Woesearchaeota archaeon]|nr:hypothetical protein [Candidatus Woesearchaeota archaeon]